MIRSDLFQRFFLRFAGAVIVALMVFVFLVHVFQKRFIVDEWREDLRQEARWLALHTLAGREPELADAWRSTHSTIRLALFGADGELLADSQPELAVPDLPALRRGEGSRGRLAVVEPVRGGGWLVMSRPGIPAFPHGLRWELIAAGVLVVGLVGAFLYPLVRSLSSTLRQLTGIAQEVSSGHFGKTLSVQRRGELGALVRAVNDMSARLAEAEQLNTRLLHDVSHELRSPLGRIQVMAQTLARHPDRAAELVRDIEQEIALLDRLVGELVDTARMESDDGMRSETFSLSRWSRETLRRLESEARAHGIGWSIEMPERDREVRGDPQRLAQAAGNLVDNAIHALDGRPEPRIDVTLGVGDAGWSLTVADNGPGIPAKDLPHVFRRFFRVEEHRDRARGGVGLGLSLVRAIAEAHGGEASIESSDAGTRVTLSFPNGRA